MPHQVPKVPVKSEKDDFPNWVAKEFVDCNLGGEVTGNFGGLLFLTATCRDVGKKRGFLALPTAPNKRNAGWFAEGEWKKEWRQELNKFDPFGLGTRQHRRMKHNGKKGCKLCFVHGLRVASRCKIKKSLLHPSWEGFVYHLQVYRVLTQEMWLLQVHNICLNLPCHDGWMMACQ